MSEVLNGRCKTIAVTETEGSCWQTFKSASHNSSSTVHAIMFEDGSVWDAVNGWRGQKQCTHCLGMGRVYD